MAGAAHGVCTRMLLEPQPVGVARDGVVEEPLLDLREAGQREKQLRDVIAVVAAFEYLQSDSLWPRDGHIHHDWDCPRRACWSA